MKTLRIIPVFVAGLLTVGCTAIDRDPILGSSPQTPIIKRNNTIPSPDKKSDSSREN